MKGSRSPFSRILTFCYINNDFLFIFRKPHNKYKLPLDLAGEQDARPPRKSNSFQGYSRSSGKWQRMRARRGFHRIPLHPAPASLCGTSRQYLREINVLRQYDGLVTEGAKYFRHSMQLLCDA